MAFSDERLSWRIDGVPLRVGLARCGSGPTLLLLPALSSISTRSEMRPLQELRRARFATVAVDWPGFGSLLRPKLAWQPDHYRAFLRSVCRSSGRFSTGSTSTALSSG